MTPGGGGAQIRQTDPGAGVRGVLQKTSDACSTSDFQGRYVFALSGISTPFTNVAGRSVSIEGIVDADGNGHYNFTQTVSQNGEPTPPSAGKYEVDSDCIVQLEFGSAKLRGILVNGGKDVLAIQTDPGQTATARFSADAHPGIYSG